MQNQWRAVFGAVWFCEAAPASRRSSGACASAQPRVKACCCWCQHADKDAEMKMMH
jgi:hypothetical protein